MKFLSVLLLAAASAAVAKDGEGKNSTAAQCRQVFKLEHLTKLASNETELKDRTQNNATKIEEIKAKASKAAEKLKTLESNSALMKSCEQIKAVRREERSCVKMLKLQHLEKLVANATALEEATKGNSTKADRLKSEASEKKAELESLQSNSTLTTFCSVWEDKARCNAMGRFKREVEHAKNETYLKDRFKGNTTKIDEFKAKAKKAAEKLEKMESNSTLSKFCSNLKKSNPSGDKPAQGSNSAPGGTKAMALSTSLYALFVAGMIAL